MKLINLVSIHKNLPESCIAQQSVINSSLESTSSPLSELYRNNYSLLEQEQLVGRLAAPDFTKTTDSLGLHASIFHATLVFLVDILI